MSGSRCCRHVSAWLALVCTLSACTGGSPAKQSAQASGKVAVAEDGASEASKSPSGTAAREPDGVGLVRLLPPGEDPREVEVEVVYTPAGRQRGLMFRKTMAPDAGMLFLFPREQQLSFWMRNTYLPLDMIFIRADRTVLGVVENAEPLTETSRRVPGHSQYVLEVNAGYARKFGIGPGTRVEFEAVGDEAEEVR